jgi:hypothetical protein
MIRDIIPNRWFAACHIWLDPSMLANRERPYVPFCAEVREEAPVILALRSVQSRRRSTSIRLAAPAAAAARTSSTSRPTRGESTGAPAAHSCEHLVARSVSSRPPWAGPAGRYLVSIGDGQVRHLDLADVLIVAECVPEPRRRTTSYETT